ncbi:hypothetical protein DFJ58DRAFT_725437 [Suillus subalutaceus]|uniref:uncharacterized protein n=1 Tax=Suillus subalutaceus TaxID=48586 RepID=UPI001B873D19|nr:uncharacterized protein DFJ58DRAFT_725437 [Suillus subalutaceus]KAG1862016.1 hypothetical protein DFJ58DRAFT_725437 [Suillus subalutaceus]
MSSTPELWTRICCALPLEDQRVTSQLKKAGSYPVHLIIKQNLLSRRHPSSLISSHLQRLKSLIMTNVFDGYGRFELGALTGDAPQLECLRLTIIRRHDRFIGLKSCLELECPALRILYIDKNMADYLGPQWLKNNTQHIDVMTIYGGYSIDMVAPLAIFRVLKAIPRRIPCLILDNLQLYPASQSITIYAEKIILRTCIRDTLAAFDGDCQTIVLQECDAIHELRCLSLPPLKLIGVGWIILYLLGAPFARRSCCLWPRVTTLKLIAKGDFVMEFPLITLKAMVSSRREAVGQENLGKDGEELDGMRPLMVLHVHGAQPLPCKEKMWFKKQVMDFVWD